MTDSNGSGTMSHFLSAVVVAILSCIVYLGSDSDFLLGIIKFSYFDSERVSFSSVFCSGSDNTNRRCMFKNLYFKSDTGDFVFVFDQDQSNVFGVPENRFKPCLVDLSTVANHNKYFFNYIELPSRIFSNFSSRYELLEHDESTILFGRFKPDNFMHMLHDDVLPLYRTVHDLKLRPETFNVFFHDEWPNTSDHQLKFNSEWYEKLVKSKKNIYLRDFTAKNVLVRFAELHVGLSKDTLWYDYGFREPQGPIAKSSVQLRSLSQTIISVAKQSTGTMENCEETFAAVISRQNTRLIMNELDVMRAINQATGLKTFALNLEAFLTVKELVLKLRCIDVLVGMHGSGLALSLFLRPGSAVVEMFPYAIEPKNYAPYRTLAKIKNLAYATWQNIDQNSTIQHPDHPEELGGIRHLSPRDQATIIETTTVPEHICCDDVNWLFHAYQDTFVDLTSFENILHEVQSRRIEQSLSREEDFSDALFHPGPIRDGVCHGSVENNKGFLGKNVSWREPWNTEFIDNHSAKVVYELVSKAADGSDTAQIYFTRNNHYLFPLEGRRLIWISCHVRGLKGPFQVKPIKC